jgi:hypothetical protein
MEVMDLHISSSLLDSSVVLSNEQVNRGLAPSYVSELDEEE